jgi:large conductance mechanosensitive channel
MLSGFKQFILRGNVVDMAVGVVIGAAFGGVVTALTADFLTPLHRAIVGKPDFSAIHYTINGTLFPVGPFHQRRGLVSPDRRRRLFLCGHAR